MRRVLSLVGRVRPPAAIKNPTHKFGKKAMELYGLTCFYYPREPKYMVNEYVDEVRLRTLFFYYLLNFCGVRHEIYV